MDRTGLWTTDQGRVRVVWRIGLYLVLFLLFSLAGQVMVSLLPRDPLGWVGLIVNTAAAVAAGLVVLSRYDDRPTGALGFAWRREAVAEFGGGALFGALLLTLAAGLLLATGTVRFLPDAGGAGEYLLNLGWTLLYFALAAALEEALFRGYAFQALVEAAGVWPAVLSTSALFALGHAANPNIDAIAYANIFLAGVWLALAYLRTRSLWFATAAHLGWNWVMASVLDFPVSGLTRFDTPVYTARVVGPEWWTGGNFGPEAGLAGTLALLVAIAWLLRTRRLREPAWMRELGPLVDARLAPDQPRAGSA